MPTGEPRIRVLVCDDSAVIRGLVVRLLESDPAIEIAGTAANGRDAIAAVSRVRPDVVVLDIEMPVMDGLTALPELLKREPRPEVVMASTLTTRGAEVTLRALHLGAADYVPKPTSVAGIPSAEEFRRELLGKVKALGAARRRRAAKTREAALPTVKVRPRSSLTVGVRPEIVAIGASTGGPQALFRLVRDLGPGFPLPVLITQHMPAPFLSILAEHLTKLGALPCREGRDGERLEPGRIYLAPGDRHLLVRGDRAAPRIVLSDGPPENFCRPAVDPMFRSVAEVFGARAIVVVLTGMGQDGLAGARDIAAKGGIVLAQDEATSVVWGMPGAVAQADLATAVLPIDRIGQKIAALCSAAAGAA
ncbi:MAG: chemotaxis response regulator protein-glutamate methylesterase [Elioraea sp.]|nr:chemotaxis response regulator protein-glutamate methylesterase [Elioraea sp.]